MFYVNSCCFCIDLRSGALILGWLGIFVSFGGFYMVEESIREVLNDEVIDEFDKDILNETFINATTSIVIFLIVLAVHISLIFGVYKRSLRLIEIWLVFTIFSIVLNAIFIFITISAMKHKYTVTEISGIVALTFCYLAMYAYSWMSIISLRQVIKLRRPIGLNWDRLLSDEHYDLEKEFEKVFEYLQKV